MAVLPIRVFPDPVLLQPALPVEQFDDALLVLLDDMAETMYVSEGIGLAAPQVGVSKRVVVIDVAPKEEQGKNLIELVNPVIVGQEGSCESDEGCLSFPELSVNVKRAASVVVEYYDRQGQHMRISAGGLLGVCLQHEIDHIDGVTMVDRLSGITRRLKLREFSRLRKAAGR